MFSPQQSASTVQLAYDISDLVREAQYRWLKPVEVYFILQNYEEHQLTHQVPPKPAGGSLYLFNKRVLKFFRKDGHNWRRRKDQKNIAEAHEKLKVGNVEALNCYYAHGAENPNFQRRIFWMLDQAYEHIVLVHYRDVDEGIQSTRSMQQLPPVSSSIFSSSPHSFTTPHTDSSRIIGESYDKFQNESSPSSVEIASSDAFRIQAMSQLEATENVTEITSSLEPDLNEALRKIEQQLSLDDNELKEINSFDIRNEDANALENGLHAFELSDHMANDLANFMPPQSNDIVHHYQPSEAEEDVWREVLYDSNHISDIESHSQFGTQSALKSLSMIHHQMDSMAYHAYSSVQRGYGVTSAFSSLFYQDMPGVSLENSIGLTISQKQKFTIKEVSPEWCYDSEGAKIIVIGSFLCDPSECSWRCMFDDTEVPLQIIQEGVLCCHAPPHMPGKVSICITSGNRESCSEIKEFEYRAKPNICMHNHPQENETSNKSSEELLLLVRFVQMLLSETPKGDNPTSIDDSSRDPGTAEDAWSQITDTLLVGNSTSSNTLDWLLQEILKHRLETWLSLKAQSNIQESCLLSKKEQGIIHMVAGLGFEWALKPILNCGVNVNFRDINGWTALHWAARYGREKMVASFIASGALAGAVTDPCAQDLTGETPASIAATYGHKGVAGYLSEVALTSHLSSLTLEESELSKGSAAVEAERTLNGLAKEGSSSFKDSLDAVRNAAQAAARIQSAFHAHSFRKRRQREAAKASFVVLGGGEYGMSDDDIRGISAASKLAFRNARDYNGAALSIQKNYRGYKGRKDFLSLRQKVVKIQAHVRGYQVRKKYKVSWAVGILEKAILRWRRHGVGLRGFRLDSEPIDEDDDEDILRVFRKQKVDKVVEEAVSRVLSMVESPKARQQYRRILDKYLQTKAELGRSASDSASSSASHADNDDVYHSI